MANSVDPDKTALIGAVGSGSMLFASILNSSKMLGNYLKQTTSADNIFSCFFFGALRVNMSPLFLFFNCFRRMIQVIVPFRPCNFHLSNRMHGHCMSCDM